MVHTLDRHDRPAPEGTLTRRRPSAPSYDWGVTLLPLPAPGAGTYRYLRNGEPTGVQESFDVPADPAAPLHSERRAPGGVRLRVEVTQDGPADAGCVLHFRSDALVAGGIAEVVAEYRLEGGHLVVTRTVGSHSSREVVESSEHAVLSPLLRVFQGPAIAACLATADSLDVIVPDLTAPDDPGHLLAPLVQRRRAERRGVELVETDGGPVLWRHCAYVGGNYDDTADFWLDDRDRLVRYRYPESPDSVWEVVRVAASADGT